MDGRTEWMKGGRQHAGMEEGRNGGSERRQEGMEEEREGGREEE